MAFDFDNFINRVCVGNKDTDGNIREGIFGRTVFYIPAATGVDGFLIAGDFHEEYEEVQPSTMMDSTSITSYQITLFIRKENMPDSYPKPLQGDYIKLNSRRFQIVDVQIHIPGSLKLILHEDL